MTRRVVVVALAVPAWTPPGIEPAAWRRALADDAVDLLATLAEVTPALAVARADRPLAEAGWPTMTVYELDPLTVAGVLGAAAADGYQQAAVLATDAPDLPGMVIAKLLRPLSSRPLAVAPVTGEPTGLLGIACRLPAPGWLPEIDLDTATVAAVRAAAPAAGAVTATPGWHRLRTPRALHRLDPALYGADATRSVLAARGGGQG